MARAPVPFYMLCGSLGAGKTTLLIRLLEHWKTEGKRAGVLMNEAGDVSIDGPRAGMIADQVMNLAGGCVCCDTKEDLSRGIAQLVQDHGCDLVVLECSGLADPAEVVDGVTDLYTARLATLDRIIALLHPVSPVSGEQSSTGHYVTTQAIRCADELVLNKRDLYVPGHWERFKDSVLNQNPHARLWETTHAKIDPVSLLTPHATPRSPARTNVLLDEPGTTGTRARAPYHPIATTVRLPGLLNHERFLAWSRTLPAGLERAKGFLRFSSAPELHEFQYAPPGEPTTTPVMLLDEPDRAVVLIGRNYDVERCCSGLLSCVEQPVGK